MAAKDLEDVELAARRDVELGAECWWWYYSSAEVYKHKLDWYLNGFSIPHLGHHQLQVQ